MRSAELVVAGISLRGGLVPRRSYVMVFAMLLISLPAWAEMIDRVVASVNNEVITWSELNQAVGFNLAIGGGNRENLQAETLEGLINRRLLVQEAHRLKFVEVSDQDINNEIEKLKKIFPTDTAFLDFLKKLNISREQLKFMLGERLLVERFVEKKIGLFIRVSRDEAQEYFNRDPGRFKGRRFEDVQKSITVALQEQKLEQQLSEYLVELKNKADIREEG